MIPRVKSRLEHETSDCFETVRWWLKRYESEQVIPWQATEKASASRLELLGIKMPDRDIHMYEPDVGFV